MTRQKNRLIVFLPALILISSELIRTFIRPVYGQRKYGLVSDILGWLPNFLGAFAFILMAMVAIILLENLSAKAVLKKYKVLLLGASTLVGLAGFILHEITQKGSGLVFDIADIYASIAGIFFGACLFYFILIKKKAKLLQ